MTNSRFKVQCKIAFRSTLAIAPCSFALCGQELANLCLDVAVPKSELRTYGEAGFAAYGILVAGASTRALMNV